MLLIHSSRFDLERFFSVVRRRGVSSLWEKDQYFECEKETVTPRRLQAARIER